MESLNFIFFKVSLTEFMKHVFTDIFIIPLREKDNVWTMFC